MIMAIALAVLQGQAPASVRVFDADFELVSVIDEPGDLEEFQSLWEDRTVADSSVEPDFSLKVDIVTDTSSTRWLYDPEGYARVLSKRETPLFSFNRAEELSLFLSRR